MAMTNDELRAMCHRWQKEAMDLQDKRLSLPFGSPERAEAEWKSYELSNCADQLLSAIPPQSDGKPAAKAGQFVDPLFPDSFLMTGGCGIAGFGD